MPWDYTRLHAPTEHVHNNERPAITRLMYWAWLGRRLQEVFPLDSASDRRRFVLWFLLRGRRYLNIQTGWITDFRNSARLTDRAVFLLYNLLAPLYDAASHLLPQRLRSRLLSWVLDTLGHVVDTGSVAVPADPKARGHSLSAFGATLVGYARAELGLGEYLRNSALALEAANVPFSVLDCSHLAPQRKDDDTLVPLMREDNPFGINLIHVTADQLFNACVSFPAEAMVGRYNIGAWMWELPRFPTDFLHAAEFLDEIWAPTAFVRDALSESAVPVRLMPVCVTAELHGSPRRADFGLAEDRFLFVFSFDVYSFVERKNPAAVVRAFRQAFPRGDEPAGLVLKVMNADRRSPRWRELLPDIKADSRITLLTHTLQRPDWLALLSLCDAYVSLHRSEGFGFGPAEAMLLGKPVVLTGYGGVTDFARPDTALLVDHRLVPVPPGHYLRGDGQVWADPDTEHAARHMRDLIMDRNLARRVGMAGRDFIQRHHAPAVVGKIYRERLHDCLATRY